MALKPLKSLLTALFTKLRPGRAILNENRRAIYDYVRAHPGASKREIVREVGLSSRTAYLHLRILKDAAHVVEQGHTNSLRYFPADAASPQQRTRTILLREKTLQRLFDLVAQNPWLAQQDIMDLADRELAWSRSTTQHRLGRLVKGGLVQVRKQGKFKLHAVAEAPVSFRPMTLRAETPPAGPA